MKTCYICMRAEPEVSFKPRYNYCRVCGSEKDRERRLRQGKHVRRRASERSRPGEKCCARCSQWKPEEAVSGGWCRSCRAAAEAARRVKLGIKPRRQSKVTDTEKWCVECEQWKPLTAFTDTPRGRGGKAVYCKPCHALRYKNKSKARAATARYRERHGERWKALHRIHQYRRRFQKEVSADGSVTDAVLKELYARSRCHYCRKITPASLRTLEHRQPLSRGGTHTAENLVMACLSCNCGKQARTEEEYIAYVKTKSRTRRSS